MWRQSVNQPTSGSTEMIWICPFKLCKKCRESRTEIFLFGDPCVTIMIIPRPGGVINNLFFVVVVGVGGLLALLAGVHIDLTKPIDDSEELISCCVLLKWKVFRATDGGELSCGGGSGGWTEQSPKKHFLDSVYLSSGMVAARHRTQPCSGRPESDESANSKPNGK